MDHEDDDTSIDEVSDTARTADPAPQETARPAEPEAADDVQAIIQIKAVTEEMFRQQAEHLQLVNAARMRSQRRESIMLIMTAGACVAAIIAAVAAVIAAAS